MVAHDYLSLKDVVLNPGEEWTTVGEGLFLVFAQKGEVDFSSGMVTRRLAAGDLLLAYQSGAFLLSLVARSQASLRFFSICAEQLYPLFGSEEIPLLHGVLDRFKSPKLYAASGAVAKKCHRSLDEIHGQPDLRHSAGLLRVTATVLAGEFKQAQTRPPGYVRIEEHVAKVLEDLTAEDILNLSVNELAEEFSLSRRHLNRVFHEHFGVSVGTLRMEMRLLRAMFLLHGPGAKVIEVAEQSGFHHLGLFNTCFKRRFGLNPSQCRRQTERSTACIAGLPQTDANCALLACGLCPWHCSTAPNSPAPKRETRVVSKCRSRPWVSATASHQPTLSA
jgi:AraC-like DNA-binding protein